jgi:hypothetical protein
VTVIKILNAIAILLVVAVEILGHSQSEQVMDIQRWSNLDSKTVDAFEFCLGFCREILREQLTMSGREKAKICLVP